MPIRERRMTSWLLKWATGLSTLGIFLFLTICRLEINAHVFFKNWISPLDQPAIEPLSKCFENLQGNKTFTVNITPGLPVWEDNTCFDFAQLFQSSKHPFEGSQVFHTFWSSHLTSYFDEKPMATLRSFAATQSLNYTLTVWIPTEDEERLVESEGWGLAEKTQRIRYQIIHPDTLVRGTALEPYVKEIWGRTNLLRMLVLYQYGGVWFDLDTMFIRDMSPLFEHEWIAQGGCRSDPFTGALFHFHRQSPFVCEILEGAGDLFKKNESGEDPEIFGSKLYYRVYKRLLHHQIRPWSALSWCFTDPSRCGRNSLPSMFVNIDLDKEKVGKAFAYHWRGRWNYMPGSIFKYLESMNKKKVSW
ncbi:unnamed protein product [Rhizopus stolonifer]